ATNEGDNDVDNIERVNIDNAQPGVYTIQVTHKGNLQYGAPQAYTLIASGTTGLTLATNNVDFDNKIVLYPNPAGSVLNFAVPNNGEISSAVVFDILGKQVALNSNTVGNSIDVSHLSKGVYFVKFAYEGKLLIKKFVKE